MTASADIETILGGFDASESLISKYQRLFTDKLAFRWLEVLGVWSLDSATPATPAYPAHALGSPDGRNTGSRHLLDLDGCFGRSRLLGQRLTTLIGSQRMGCAWFAFRFRYYCSFSRNPLRARVRRGDRTSPVTKSEWMPRDRGFPGIKGCSLTSWLFGGWKLSGFSRLTVPPQLLVLTPPTLVARRSYLLYSPAAGCDQSFQFFRY
jgi:hypothetical protein